MGSITPPLLLTPSGGVTLCTSFFSVRLEAYLFKWRVCSRGVLTTAVLRSGTAVRRLMNDSDEHSRQHCRAVPTSVPF